jgi:hypothetical protein
MKRINYKRNTNKYSDVSLSLSKAVCKIIVTFFNYYPASTGSA